MVSVAICKEFRQRSYEKAKGNDTFGFARIVAWDQGGGGEKGRERERERRKEKRKQRCGGRERTSRQQKWKEGAKKERREENTGMPTIAWEAVDIFTKGTFF